MIEAPQPEQPEDQIPMQFYNKPIADDSLGSLQYQLDNYDINEEIIHNLKKQIQVVAPDGRIIWKAKPNTIPSINEQGLGNIVSCLKSRLNKIISLSGLEQDTIKQIVNDIHEDLIDDFYYNWEKYEIKDLATASIMIAMVTDTVYATLRKGYMGNYMKLLRSMHSIQEIQEGTFNGQNVGPTQQQSMAARFSSMFRRR